MESPPSSPRYYTSLPEADQFRVAGTALAALAEEPEIAEAMAPRKYTPELLIADGAALRETVRLAMGTQTGETGGRLRATQVQNTELAAAEARYRPLAATARVVFGDDRAALTALGLTGEHGGTFGDRLKRMRDFAAEAATPVYLDALADAAGTTEKELNALSEAVDVADLKMSAQDRLSSRSQDASEGRAAAFRALRKWMMVMHGHPSAVVGPSPRMEGRILPLCGPFGR